ncbi:Cell fate regulator YlbF, YheA/YmcA/DUF963 family (controls sporulation, competence, biofilm development) [Thermoflavimicrobium dichotomicum]|uniref:Cell fate regulator YlbF, YheA/YmcA/DUF963 family (Controls sporulation, competence, biofilm development) n=2 Tax=Thermoflavimicrobium dichotomicum TaxID=46223 RepID=A0A1I3MQQ0_9BACL|nr:Cell fate regulator YlbF, YheA/YmcA/DUF963 family (controls sporulation, competence, biofilm development) [Thermoflavimicrobium dichotomicum]
MSEILMDAYHLADQINESEEVKNYLQLKKKLQENEEAQRLIKEFQRVKSLYEEAQRFGIFHPNYHEAKEKAERFQKKLRQHPLISAYLEAEEKLDQLLYEVSATIAHSISETIKVPSNQPRSIRKKSCHRK